MGKFKGTKGNWQVVDTYQEYTDESGIVVWDGDEQAFGPICDMGEMGDMNYAEALANAKLIAAAPNMLEVCERIMHLYKEDGHLLNFNVDIVRIAISKAVGEEAPNE